MKKELILKLTETIGECVVEVETEKGHPRVEVYFKVVDSGSHCGLYDFEDYHLGMLAEFFAKAYNEVKKLNDSLLPKL